MVSSKRRQERLQVVLPRGLAAELRQRVPSRTRSGFIAKAIDRELQMLRQAQAEPDEPVWSDADYPYLNTLDDINDWREAIWSGEDPHEALRAKYAAKGVVSVQDFAAWQSAWRAGEDADAVMRGGARPRRATRAPKRTRAARPG